MGIKQFYVPCDTNELEERLSLFSQAGIYGVVARWNQNSLIISHIKITWSDHSVKAYGNWNLITPY